MLSRFDSTESALPFSLGCVEGRIDCDGAAERVGEGGCEFARENVADEPVDGETA